MTTISLRDKDVLEGPSNSIPWKYQVQNLMEEHDLRDFVETKVVVAQLVEYKKKMAKTKQVILDSLKNHLIPRLAKKFTGKEMFYALATLYQHENINQKMLLRNKIRAM